MLFGLSRAFQKGMTQPGNIEDHRAAPPQGKGPGSSQVLPGGDWAGGTTHPKVTCNQPFNP